MTNVHQKYLNKFFDEYKIMTALNPGQMTRDAAHWNTGDKIIKDLPFEKKAEYADYVMKKFCQLDHEIILSHAKELLSYTVSGKKAGSCTIGGMALLAITLDNFGDHEIADRLKDITRDLQSYL